jgi:hypothetical protein
MLRDRTEANASEYLIWENAQDILHTCRSATTIAQQLHVNISPSHQDGQILF